MLQPFDQTNPELYVCPRCDYTTHKKHYINCHFGRMTHCQNKNGIELTPEIKHVVLNQYTRKRKRHDSTFDIHQITRTRDNSLSNNDDKSQENEFSSDSSEEEEQEELENEREKHEELEEELEEIEEEIEEIVSGTISDAKEAIKDLGEPDFDALLHAEEDNKDRKTFKDWLETQKN